MLYIALHVCAKIETYLKIYMKNKKKGRNSRNQNNKTENRSKLLFNVNKICFFFVCFKNWEESEFCFIWKSLMWFRTRES